MAKVLLLHSAYGLRPAVRRCADRLRAAGHEVVAPDLFDGRTCDTVEESMTLTNAIGHQELMHRAVRAAVPLGPGLVHAGFSLGAALAQNLALADRGAAGLLLLHGTSDLADDASTDIPVQLHVAEPDPFESDDWLSAWYLRMRRAGADVEVHRYRGAGHLYTDEDLPDFDAGAATATWAVALDLLAEIDARS